jgi:hypothetical protein
MRILFLSKMMLTAIGLPALKFCPVVIQPPASAGLSPSTVESVRYRV